MFHVEHNDVVLRRPNPLGPCHYQARSGSEAFCRAFTNHKEPRSMKFGVLGCSVPYEHAINGIKRLVLNHVLYHI